MAEVEEVQWWHSYERYTREDLEAHELVPTDEIEEFKYEAPYPTGDAVPCSLCRGQGLMVTASGSFREKDKAEFRIWECNGCEGATEVTYLCSECGTRKQVNKGTNVIVWHSGWCPEMEYCTHLIASTGRACGRNIVARFDTHADGKMWGFCGVHARGKSEVEAYAARHKEDMALLDWREAEKAKGEELMADRVAAIGKALGIAEPLDYRTTYDGKNIVQVRVEVLEQYLETEIAKANGFVPPVDVDDSAGPDPF